MAHYDVISVAILSVLFTTDGFVIGDALTPNVTHLAPDSIHMFTSLPDSGQCADISGFDCQQADTYLQVCSDIEHAKVACRLFCDLCNLVDGNWSEWSPWSVCHSTCGNGTMARTRTCTNPAPAHRGSNCTGPDTELLTCMGVPCPIHGGWDAWSHWGTCTVTCGVGTQRRDRTCTNPTPLYSGNHCFGDSQDVRLCFPGHCADGGWSVWTNWGSCSKTCGIGIRTRDRYCTNPAPSMLGRYCQGPPSQSDTCGTHYDPSYEIVYNANGSCCLEYNVQTTSHVFLLWYGSKVRLCDGNGPNECSHHRGRVEIAGASSWGTLCDNAWDKNNYAADFMCQSIGFCKGTAVPSMAGPSSFPIYFGVNCTSTTSPDQSSTYKCHQYNSNCTHDMDLTVLCE